jgi:acyl-CoA hydrolase
MSPNKKSAAASRVEMTELVLPNDTNLLGNLLGGRLMHWMDIAGGMSSSRYSNHTVVTAAVDNLTFHRPIKLGELVNLRAVVTWTGRTSMEIKVSVHSENTSTGKIYLANEAFFTFVALDDNGNPAVVPPLQLESEAEKTMFKAAEERRRKRLKLKAQKEER